MSNKEISTEITAMIFCLVMAVAIGFVVGQLGRQSGVCGGFNRRFAEWVK